MEEKDDNVTKVNLSQKVDDINSEDNVTKLDLSKKETEVEEKVEDANQEQEATDVVADEQAETVQEVVEEVPQEPEAVQDEQPVIEEVNDTVEEEVKEKVEEVEEAIAEAEATGEPLPENIQKLIDFMNETGGDIEDYVNLNKDYSQLDNMTALTEYYKKTKPHLSAEEIDFLIEDSFNYNEEEDDERDIKRKKLALKEQVASAKAYLDGQKSKYYDEIKAWFKVKRLNSKKLGTFLIDIMKSLKRLMQK